MVSKSKIIIVFFIIISNFIADRTSKIYVINFFLENKNINEIYYNDFLNFILIWNKGIAFGLLGFENFWYYVISLIILSIIFFLFYQIFLSRSIFLTCVYSIIIGGALGNLFDRFYYGLVPDFIDIHYKNFHWFTFNVADISITLGIFLLLFNEIIFKTK